MDVKLIESKKTIDDEQVLTWKLNKGNGTIVINLNKLVEEDITECYWLDEKKKFLAASYTDWDCNELQVIVNADGMVLRKGIICIEGVLEKQQLFIVLMSGFGMGDDAAEFLLAADDRKWAVMDIWGDFVIPPQYARIDFDEDEQVFSAENYGGKEYWFSISGKPVNDPYPSGTNESNTISYPDLDQIDSNEISLFNPIS